MYEELIEKLRHRGIEYNGISIFDEAAEAIEKLEAKNKELESKMHDSFTEHLLNQISRKEKQIDGLKAEKSKLEKELEQVRAERETYKMFFDDVTGKPDCNDCGRFECEYKPKVGETTRFNCPLWRGVQGGKDD